MPINLSFILEKKKTQYVYYIGGGVLTIVTQVYKEELRNVAATIGYLNAGGTLSINGQAIQVEPMLVCDMKAVVRLLGLYNVFSPSATWKCAWCKVSSSNIADFTREHWPFRDKVEWEAQLTDLDGKSDRTRASYASENWGVRERPVLNFPVTHVIPCMLHCVMAVVQKLFQLLTRDSRHNPCLEHAWEMLLEELGIKLVPKGKGKEMKALADRVLKSRFNHSQCLLILTSIDHFLDKIPAHPHPLQKQQTAEVGYFFAQTSGLHTFHKVWRKLRELVVLSGQEDHEVQISAAEWRAEARSFGALYAQRHGAEEVTPYIHVLVYHVGYWLEHYGGIEKFANYATEGMVAVNKRNLRRGSSMFGGRNATPAKIAAQQLRTTNRWTWRVFNNLLVKWSVRKRKPVDPTPIWAKKQLALCPHLQRKFGRTAERRCDIREDAQRTDSHEDVTVEDIRETPMHEWMAVQAGLWLEEEASRVSCVTGNDGEGRTYQHSAPQGMQHGMANSDSTTGLLMDELAGTQPFWEAVDETDSDDEESEELDQQGREADQSGKRHHPYEAKKKARQSTKRRRIV